MRDELLGYYERELAYLRRAGVEFAEKYPKIASRLLLEADRCADPHVERLIEAFAFLAARIHRKLDDDLPEATEALLGVLYPELLAPVPSLSIVEMRLDPEQACPTAGVQVPRHTPLFSKPVQGTPCRFRTAYGVTLWPVEVVASSRETVRAPRRVDGIPVRGLLRLRLRGGAAPRLRDLEWRTLRFYLHGEERIVRRIHETLFRTALAAEVVRPGRGGVKAIPERVLGRSRVRAVGFDPEESLLPTSARTSAGYRLVQEYFAFPEKFLFFEVDGLEAVRGSDAGDEVEIAILLDEEPDLPETLDPGTFRLGCTPIVNLFRCAADPISLTRTSWEYDVVPDARRRQALEVHTIETVRNASPGLERSLEYRPFFSFRLGDDPRRARPYWHATRRPSGRVGDAGTEVSIAFVDRGFEPASPGEETVVVTLLCSNRDLPERLPFGREDDFQAEGFPAVRSIRCLRLPTPSLRPPRRRRAQWNLVALLAGNYLSVADDEGEALRGVLRALDFTESTANARQVQGVVGVGSRPVLRPIRTDGRTGFCRGTEVTVTFDPEKFVGTGEFLLASVLERFLALHATANSFTEFVARRLQREGDLHRWPPRVGDRALV